ncbi:MAG: GNAT family N-acetyltransferase [Chloroflexota bacterium]
MTEPRLGTRAHEIVIRRADGGDGAAIGEVWLASWRATFDFPPAHPDDDVRTWLATEMLETRETWVAADPDGRVVALMALSPSMIDQLYVAPDRLGSGIGSRLVELAKLRRPAGLDLHCFAVNGRARAFYEGRGFRAVATGDGSHNEEGQPDIRYAWRPAPAPAP